MTITSLYPTIYHLPSYQRNRTVPSALIIFRSKDHFWPGLSAMYGSYNMKHRNVDLYARHMFTKNNNRHKQWIAGFQARQTFLTIRHLYRHRAQNYFFYCFSKLLQCLLTPQKSFDHPYNLKSRVPPPPEGRGGGGGGNESRPSLFKI